MTTNTGTPKKPRSQPNSVHTWHLVTNHQNMLYMLAAGMVMSPAGFRGKHYSDPLSVDPGWIPLFRSDRNIPADALKRATEERKHLLPCIASFDLSGVSSPVWMLSRNGHRREVTFSRRVSRRKDDIAILIQAPLPTNLLLSINFRSSEEMQAFESAANDVSNVDLSPLRIDVSTLMFATDTDVKSLTAPPQAELIGDGRDNFPAFGQALGGALAMLYLFANRSDLGLAAFRSVTRSPRDKGDGLAQSDVTTTAILAELPSWVNGGNISGEADTRTRLFWGVVEALITAQTQKHPQTPVDVALEYLDSQLDDLRETEESQRLERLIADMRGCLGLGGGTITELLERHKGSLSRPLLLFCLRENCTALLEFSHPLLNDAEYILAGILFGVRDSWLQFPKELRDPVLSAYVTYQMAAAEHRKQGDEFTLNKPPPRPKPLRELFTSGGEWSSQQRNEALELARKCNWNDCIQTRITLAEGDYPGSFQRNGLQVVLPGRVRTVTEEVDTATFLRRLGQWPPLDPETEAKVRKGLKSAQEIEEQKNGHS